MTSFRVVRSIAVTSLLLAATLVAFAPGVRQCTFATLDWMEHIGIWGPAAFVLLYIIATIGFIPGILLTLGAGAVFGLWVGMLAVVIGSNLGAIAAFVLGRSLMHGWTAEMVARRPSLAALDRAVARQGFRIVLLSRLSPLFPFNLLNYAFAVTNISLRDYIVASAIGMLPGTTLYVCLGAAAGSLAKLSTDAQGNAVSRYSFAIGLIATLALTIYLHRLAKNALAGHALIESPEATTAEGDAAAEQ